MLWWYAGPVNQMPYLDFTGTSQNAQQGYAGVLFGHQACHHRILTSKEILNLVPWRVSSPGAFCYATVRHVM